MPAIQHMPFEWLLSMAGHDDLFFALLLGMIAYLWIAMRPLFATFVLGAGHRRAIAILLGWVILLPILYLLSRVISAPSSFAAAGVVLLLVALLIPLVAKLRAPRNRSDRLIGALWLISLLVAETAAWRTVALFNDSFSSGYYHRLELLEWVWAFDVLACRALVFYCAAALFGSLWHRWRDPEGLTDPERLSGLPGIRAWLTPHRLILCGGFALCCWAGYDSSLLQSIVISLILAAIVSCRPLWLMLVMQDGAASAAGGNASSPRATERARVLQLLEENRITAQECQDLLHAIGEAETLPSPGTLLAAQKMMRLRLAGLVLFLVAFVALPWLSLDLGREIRRAGGQIGQMSSIPGLKLDVNAKGQAGGRLASDFVADFASTASAMGEVKITPADLRNGLGWWMLGLALAGALVTWLFPDLSETTRTRLPLLCSGLALGLALYLLFSGFRYVSIGLPVAVAGLALVVYANYREAKSSLPRFVR